MAAEGESPWTFVLVETASGRNLSYLSPRVGAKWRRRLSNYAELGFELERQDKVAALVQAGTTAVQGYRDGQLKFYGPAWEPVVRSRQGLQLVARDPFAVLHGRFTRTQVTFASTDAAEIAHQLWEAQHSLASVWLQRGPTSVSINRDRTYEPGKAVAELIMELAGTDDGFFFLVEPVVGEPGVLGELHIRYPDPGTTRYETRFEFGSGTQVNIEDFRVEESFPINRVTATGTGLGGTALTAVAEDTDSIARAGMFEVFENFPDVTVQEDLDQKARERLEPSGHFAVKITPNASSPKLGIDFEVGDWVRLRIEDDPAYNLNTWARVNEAELEITATGTELLTDLTLEVLDFAHHRVRGVTDGTMDDLFIDSRRRINTLERALVKTMRSVAPPAPPPAPPAPGPAPAPSGGPPPPPPTPPAPPPSPAHTQPTDPAEDPWIPPRGKLIRE